MQTKTIDHVLHTGYGRQLEITLMKRLYARVLLIMYALKTLHTILDLHGIWCFRNNWNYADQQIINTYFFINLFRSENRFRKYDMQLIIV